MSHPDDLPTRDLAIVAAPEDRALAVAVGGVLEPLLDVAVLDGDAHADAARARRLLVFVAAEGGRPRHPDLAASELAPRVVPVFLDPGLDELPLPPILALSPAIRAGRDAGAIARAALDLAGTPREEGGGVLPWIRHDPAPPGDFVGREPELRALLAWARGAGAPPRVVALRGAPGSGRSALLGKVVEALRDREGPGGILAWSFSQDPRVDAFFNEALSYFLGEAPRGEGSGGASRLQQALSDGAPHLLVLDGVEELGSGEDGRLADPALRLFLRAVRGGWVGRTRVLLTAEDPAALLGGAEGLGWRQLDVGPLAPDAGLRLLAGAGAVGEDARSLGEALGWRPFALRLAGACCRLGWSVPELVAAAGAGGTAAVDALFTALVERLDPVSRALATRIAALPHGVGPERLVELAGMPELAGDLAGLDAGALDRLLGGLAALGLVEARDGDLRMAPLVRRGLVGFLDVDPEALHDAVGSRLAAGLSLRPGEAPRDARTLDELERLVELTRRSGRVREAFALYRGAMGGWSHLGEELSDYHRVARLLGGFCEDGPEARPSPELHWSEASLLLTELGLAREALGDLDGAIACHLQAERIDAEANPDLRQRQLDRAQDARNLAVCYLLRGRLAEAARHARASIDAYAGAEVPDPSLERGAKVVPLFGQLESVRRPVPVERRDPRVAAVTGDRRIAWGAGRLPVCDPDTPSDGLAEHLPGLDRWLAVDWDRLAPVAGRLAGAVEGVAVPGDVDGAALAVLALMAGNGDSALLEALDAALAGVSGLDEAALSRVRALARVDGEAVRHPALRYRAFGRWALSAEGEAGRRFVAALVAAARIGAPERGGEGDFLASLVGKAALARVVPVWPEGIPGVGVLRVLDDIWRATPEPARRLALALGIDLALRRPEGTPWPVPPREVRGPDGVVLVQQPAPDALLAMWAALGEAAGPVGAVVAGLDPHERRWAARFDLAAARSAPEEEPTDEAVPVIHRVRRPVPAPELHEVLGAIRFFAGDPREAEAHFNVVRREMWRTDEERGDDFEGLGVLFAETRLRVGDRVGAREYAEFGAELAGGGVDPLGPVPPDGRRVDLFFRGRLVIAHALLRRQPERSRELLADTRAWAVAAGHVECIVRAHVLASALALEEGDAARAAEEAAEGRDLAESCGFDLLAVDCGCALARARLAAGEARAAREAAEAAARVAAAEGCGYAWGEADALHLAGEAALRLGDAEAAGKRLAAALDLRLRLEHPETRATRRLLEGLPQA